MMDPIVAARPTADFVTRSNYAAAVAARVDSFWVPDHLNALFPRSLWNNPKYCGGAKLLPKADAYLEPWMMLGNIAARNRARLRLGIGVTDTGRRNPAVTAQAAATLQLLTRGRAILGIGTGEREGNEPYGVDWSKPVARFEEAMATIRALWNSNGELVNRESPFFPLRNALFDLPPVQGQVAGDLDCRPRPPDAACGRPLRRRLLPGLPAHPRRSMRSASRRCAPPRQTPAATRWRSSRRCGS